MSPTLTASASQLNTLIYLFAHLCYAASMVFFFSRTLTTRFSVKKALSAQSPPSLGILLLYTGFTGDAQSPFFKVIFLLYISGSQHISLQSTFLEASGKLFFHRDLPGDC